MVISGENKVNPIEQKFLRAKVQQLLKNQQSLIQKFYTLVLLVFCTYALLLTSCASTQPTKETEPTPVLSEVEVAQNTEHREEPSTETMIPEPKVPEFVPVEEDISPIQTKVVSISARNTPLRDVLFIIAETANLNLVMERGVNPELPITMTLNNMSVENALNTIFDSVDYFYSIKDNILIVKSMGTKIFELAHPNIIQEYKTDVGGDILGGVSTGEGQGTEGTASTQGAIKGEVSLKSTSDKVSFQFWDALENSLKTLLPASTGGEDIPKASFTINRMAGTIMVTASKKDIERVENYLVNLQKVLNRQVLIEARIVEVQLSEGLKYGIDWSFISNWRGVGTINLGATKFSDVVGSTSPSFQIGVTGSDFTSILNALQEQGNVRILSNPRVNILNGQTAMLGAGRNTSFISRVESTTTTESGASTTTFSIETKSVLSGVMFGLVPFISEEGKITLTITPIVSNIVELEPKTIGTVEVKLPTVDLREMSTTVKILNGQMVIIGGLIDRKETLKEKKIPILGDIPLLGYLFKSVNKSYENTELVIMLIPKIVSN